MTWADFSSIGRIGNNQMHHIACVLLEVSIRTWEWFCDLLKNDLGTGNDHDWTFVSDQQKIQ